VFSCNTLAANPSEIAQLFAVDFIGHNSVGVMSYFWMQQEEGLVKWAKIRAGYIAGPVFRIPQLKSITP
jgi:hypothetical protein